MIKKKNQKKVKNYYQAKLLKIYIVQNNYKKMVGIIIIKLEQLIKLKLY